jgi:hypothetical protein
MFKENRFYTKTGKAKRISADVKNFKQWADNHKADFVAGNTIEIVKNLRIDFNLSLTNATNLMVFLVGCYSNGNSYGFGHVNGPLFRAERYEAGKLVADSLSTNNVFDIRKLELVK